MDHEFFELYDQYVNGNRKDFARMVKQYGLGKFIAQATYIASTDEIVTPHAALEMVGVAVNLGGYE